VLHVIDSLDLGGAQTLLLDICKNTNQERFETEIACMHGSGVFAQEFEKSGIKVHSLSHAKWPPHYVLTFPGLLKDLDPDLIHFHLFGSNLIAKPLAALLGKRALIVHDHCNDSGRGNPIMLVADALTNRVASRVIAVSESVRLFLLSREGLDPERVVTLSNGIDPEEFKPATSVQKMMARQSLGLPEGSFVIGGVGRLVPQKNFALFLEVAARMKKLHSKCLFLIAGTGPLESELREQATLLGLDGNLRFLGHVSERATLYHALDALLMTSDFEGTPMVLLEAMASGLPVVASAVDGVAEVCTDRENALLINPRDGSAFSEALAFLIAHSEGMEWLGENARKTIFEKYDIRQLAHRIEQIYDEVLSENG